MKKLAILIAAVFCFCVLSGCNDDDPVKPKQPVFKPLTDKENVIYNLVKSYEKADIEHYCALLDEDFLWYLWEGDAIATGIDSFTFAVDSALTSNMFASSRGERIPTISNLTLEIIADSWTVVDTLDGMPCTDCWSTQRAYTLIFLEGDVEYVASQVALFVVVPVSVGGDTEYRLHFVYDMLSGGRSAAWREGSDARAISPTWSLLKLMFE